MGIIMPLPLACENTKLWHGITGGVGRNLITTYFRSILGAGVC